MPTIIMNNKCIPDVKIPQLTQSEIEFCQAICSSEEVNYPWNPQRIESQPYFTELEASTANLTDLPEAEIAAGAKKLFSHLDRLWDVATTVGKRSNSLEDQLREMLPTSLLKAIDIQVRELKISSLNLAEKLVICTQEVMPQWAVEDLQVLARPFAYAMRGNDPEDAIDASMPQVAGFDWTRLSEIEQVRLCLAYARYSLEG